MSGGTVCKCSERAEPVEAPPGSNRPARLWRIITYRGNHSAFNGNRFTSSDYSSVTCLRCGSVWRTTAAYVDKLGHRHARERDISCGHAGHIAAMAERGRAPHPNNAGTG